jgi:hypothetical protein
MGQATNGHSSVRIHDHQRHMPSTEHKSLECGKIFIREMLLLTVYGEFRVPVDFIQTNGFIQFHLR